MTKASKQARMARVARRQQRYAQAVAVNDAIKAARSAGTPAAVTAQQLGLPLYRVKKISGAFR